MILFKKNAKLKNGGAFTPLDSGRNKVTIRMNIEESSTEISDVKVFYSATFHHESNQEDLLDVFNVCGEGE